MTIGKEVHRRHDRLRTALGCIALVVALVLSTLPARVAAQPKTVAEIALYQGADREKILVEGARKEGELIYYNVNTWLNNTVAKEFEKKYPFIKVSAWRSDSQTLLKRVSEEYAARRYLVDIINTSSPTIKIILREGIYQEFYTPEAAHYEDDVKLKGKIGLSYLGDLELYFSLGINTKLVTPADAPKTWKDLLDPRWKGRMSIVGTSTGVQVLGNAIEVNGREYVQKLSQQDMKLQNVSAAAMATLIISGEVPLSPSAGYSTIHQNKKKGAPVDWIPIEPVLTTPLYSGVTVKSPHPHAAMLFLDYVHSKEGQMWVVQGELAPTREDIGYLEKKFKKNYLEAKYSFEEYEKKFGDWDEMLRQLFVKKR